MLLLNTTSKTTIKGFKALLEKIRNGEDTGKRELLLPAKVIIPNNVESIEIRTRCLDQQEFVGVIPKENITFVTTDVNYQAIASNSTNQQNCRILPWKLSDANSQQIIEEIIKAISENTIRLGISIKFAELEDIEDNLSNLSMHSLDVTGAVDNMAQELNKIESLKTQLQQEKQNVINESNARIKAQSDADYYQQQANNLQSQVNDLRSQVNTLSTQASHLNMQVMGERNKAESNSRRLYDLTNEVSNLKSQLAKAKSDTDYYYQQANDRRNEIEKLNKLNLDWDQKYYQLNSQFSDYQNQVEKNGQQWKEHSDRLNSQIAQLTKKLAEEDSFIKTYNIFGRRL